jgi:hypothetical protein
VQRAASSFSLGERRRARVTRSKRRAGDKYLLETSLPSAFAAGEVRSGSIERVASTVGEGSMTVRFVHQYLADAGVRGRLVGSSPQEVTVMGTARRIPLRRKPEDNGGATKVAIVTMK